MKRRIMKMLVVNRRLSPIERISTRIGYMGAGFLIAAQWTIEPILYILGFTCVLIQTAQKKTMESCGLTIKRIICVGETFFQLTL